MKVMRLLDLETRHHHYTLALSPGEGNFTARYWSSHSRYRRPGSIAEAGIGGAVSSPDADSAISLALAQLDNLDGPVLSIVENLLKASLIFNTPGAVS